MYSFFHSADSSISSILLFLSLFLSLSLSLEGAADTSPLAPSWCLNSKLTAPNRRLYISTLNGDLTTFDLSVSSVIWSHSSNIPLYSSTFGYSEPNSHYPNLIPGLDKNMYSWDGAELTKLPYSVDDLIDQSFSSGPGLVRAGARSKDEVAINVATGKPLYKCTQLSCVKYDNNSLIGKMDRLLLTSHRTTVREAKSLTGDEIWNFTLSQVFVSLIEGEGEEEEERGGDPMNCLFNGDHTVTVHTDNDKGLLIIVDKMKERSFDLKFSSPVITVWYQFGDKLQKLQLSPTSDPSGVANKPALLLGSWKEQYYILPVTGNQSLQLILNAPPTSGRGHTNCPTSYLPLLPSDGVTSNDVTLYNKDTNWIHTLHTDGPNGLSLYFYPKVTSDNDYGYCTNNENSSNETTPTSDGYLTSIYYLLEFKSWFYSLTKYGIFALFVLGVNKFRRYQMKRLSSSSSCNDNEDEVFEQYDGEYYSVSDITGGELVKRRSSSSSTLKPTNTYSLLPTVEEEGDHTLMDRLDSNESNGSTVTSRFETDYDRLGTLGKGGFGVVYHVINKFDNTEYAIKRIKLPTKKSSRDKVMREVHALARLEHKAIVRYFNSWVEQAPPGWNNREEWTNISRANSIIQMEGSGASPKQQSLQSTTTGHNSLQYSSCTDSISFDFKLPRPQSTDSVTSFTIEFRDESNSKAQVDSSIHSNRSHDVSCTNDEKQIEIGGSSFYETSDVVPPTFLFIQMQLCRKESLKDWLRNNVRNRQRRTMLDHFKQVLDAVVYVHSKGMMHRDLKPSNIFFSLDGSVKIGDFGLVTGNITPDTHRNSHIALKQLTDDVDGVSLTGNIGTHFYISPEQVNGLQYDQKVDVFSLGVILFELNYPFVTEMERVKVLEDLRKNKIPSEFRKYLPIEASLVEWLMSPMSVRPSSCEVASSDKLSELQQLNDFTLIPKL